MEPQLMNFAWKFMLPLGALINIGTVGVGIYWATVRCAGRSAPGL